MEVLKEMPDERLELTKMIKRFHFYAFVISIVNLLRILRTGLNIVFTVSVILLFCYIPVSIAAEFSLNPSITLREEYDDNIFLKRDNKEDDYITRVMPSINMSYKTPIWDWTLDYTLNFWYYSGLGESGDSHDLDLSSNLNIIDNLLYLEITDIYLSEVLDPRRPSTDVNLEINRTDSNTFNAIPHIKYQIAPRTILYSGYRYTNIWYREDDAVDRQMHSGLIKIEQSFSPLLTGSAGIEYTADRPGSPGSDNDRIEAFLKVSYTINPRTTFDGSIGYGWLDFSDLKDTERLLYDAVLTYQLPGTGQVGLSASSLLIPSPTLGVQVGLSASASSLLSSSPTLGIFERRIEQIFVRYGEVFIVNGIIFHRKDKYFETDRRDEAVGVTGGIEYKYNPRLSFRVTGRYEKDKFRPEESDRKIYAAATGIDYKLTKKLKVSLLYNYTEEDATEDTDDYTNNIVAVQIKLDI
jgi:hypothetical protein